jgi:hypothetical protein
MKRERSARLAQERAGARRSYCRPHVRPASTGNERSGTVVHPTSVTDAECVVFLQWALPRLGLRWQGFRKVRRQVCRR